MLIHGSSDRSRSGIGNVIATIIFIFIMTFTIGQLYVFSINQFDDYNAIVLERFEATLDRLNEKIEISSATLNSISKELVLTVANTGGSTAEIISLWTIQDTLHDRNPTGFKELTISSGSSTQLSTVSTGLDVTKAFSLRLFTERGSSVSNRMIPASAATLRTELLVSPPNPVTGNNAEVNLVVTADLTDGDTVFGLAPTISLTFNPSEITPILISSPSPLSLLRRGETTVFKWIYQLNGIVADKTITFTASYVFPFSSASAAQKASGTALVRQFGGVTQQSGSGGLADTLGALVISFPSFSWSSDNANTFSSTFTVSANSRVTFNVTIKNSGQSTIIVAKEAVYVLLSADSAAVNSFYICAPTPPYANNKCDKYSTAAASSYTLAPGEEKNFYFAANGADSETASTTPTAGKNLFTFFVLIGTQANIAYGQSIPFVGLRT